MLARFGVWGAIFIVNMIQRIAQKLSIIILLHFGLVTLGSFLGELENLSSSRFSDLVDVSMTPKTNIIFGSVPPF